MGSEMPNGISTLLSESYLESSQLEETSSDSDPDISAVLLESINKSKENENKFDLTEQEISWVDSCLAFDGEENLDEMKNTLNFANSSNFENPNLDLDVEMQVVKETESANPNLEPREGIFGIWDLDFEQDSDDENVLIKDLKKLLKSGTGTDTGTADEEDSNLNLAAEKETIDEIVADLGNLSLNQIEGWSDKKL